MSDVDDVVQAWTGLWQQWVDAWAVTARAVLELGYQEQRVPGVNDARVLLAGTAASDPTLLSTPPVQGQAQAAGDLVATPLVDELGYTVPADAVSLEVTPGGPDGDERPAEVWVKVVPPPGTPSGFYACTLRRADGTVVATDVWMYVVRPD